MEPLHIVSLACCKKSITQPRLAFYCAVCCVKYLCERMSVFTLRLPAPGREGGGEGRSPPFFFDGLLCPTHFFPYSRSAIV